MSAAVVAAAGVPLLEARGLGKVFGAQAALRGVDLALHPGEIHALVGENGAGKSTLIRLLTGVLLPDAGELRWAGQPLTLAGPQAARRLGIRVIHQDRQLVPAFTALENLYLGERYPLRRGGLGVDWRRMRAEAGRAQAALGLEFPLDRLAAELTPTQQTLLELLRATLRDGRLLVFDEPSAALTDAETALLFRLMARLQAAGTALLYVSHRLDEVLAGGEDAAAYARLEALLAGATQPPGELLCLPYLQGERAPVQDPAARGVLLGLSAETTAGDLARAALAGVAHSLRQLAEQLLGRAPGASVTLLGGGGRSAAWCQLFADIWGVPLRVPEQAEHLAALGAAEGAFDRLGWLDPAAYRAQVLSRQPHTAYRPDPDRQARYEVAHRRFTRLYPALRSVWAALE